ncbi:MAG TPA: hypothetical protein PKN75_01100 [Bacteroidia bacterium]|nr:hypothetical protein [Bacteroidia bacterium]HNU32169.1 hypothetical protein [Bacteroidia bacterium]
MKKLIYLGILIITALLINSCCKLCKDKTPVEQQPCCDHPPQKPQIPNTTNRPSRPSPYDCDYCEQDENHYLDFDRAAYLIKAFHDKDTLSNLISNAGGEFHFDDTKAFSENDYLAVKFFHMYSPGNKILRVAYEYDNCKQDEDGVWHANPDIQHEKLTCHLVKDTIGRIKDYSSVQKVKEALIDYKNEDASSWENCDSSDVRRGSDAFKASDLRYFYKCQSVYYNDRKSLGEIVDQFTNGFRYYFGYDSTLTEHRLRLILIGVDSKTGHNVIFNLIFQSRIRETSRPKP